MTDSLPRGLEELLMMAAQDTRLEAGLLDDRVGTLERCASLLSASERRVLMAVGRESLAQMIRSMRPQPNERRAFLRQAAACVAALLTGTALTGCVQTKGSRPDIPAGSPHTVSPSPPTSAASPAPADSPIIPSTPLPNAGARPSLPASPGDVRTRGIRPDVPPDPVRQHTRNPSVPPGPPVTLGIRPDAPPPTVSGGVRPDVPPPR